MRIVIHAIKRLPLWLRRFLGFQPHLDRLEELDQIKEQMDYWSKQRNDLYARAMATENPVEFHRLVAQYNVCLHRYDMEVTKKLPKP